MPDPTPIVADLSTTAGAIDAIAEMARDAAGLELTTLAPLADDQVIGLRVADGSRFHVLDLELLAASPRRKRGGVTLTDPASFVEHVRRHEGDATVLYANQDAGQIDAVLNDHAGVDTTDEAGWCDHRALLQLRQTQAWKAWTGSDRKMLPQADFAEFLEERAIDVVEPDAATLLEVATTLQAKAGADFRSAIRLQNGETQITYSETIEASAGRGGDLTIPQTFTLALRVWEGTDPYRVEARLRYRINGGKLVLGYMLTRVEDVVRDAFGTVATVVADGVQAPVLLGSFNHGPKAEPLAVELA